jgi:NADH-quinone oxidoreductase subunit M
LDLPGLSSFAGEFLILAGVFAENAWFSAIAALVTILAAWYMIRFFQDTMNGPPAAAPAQIAVVAEDQTRSVYQYPVVRRLLAGDLVSKEALLFVPLIILILYVGIQPDPLTARMNPTINKTTALVHQGTTALRAGGGQ